MPNTVIGSNSEASEQTVQQLTQGIEKYCDFQLSALNNLVTVTGSATHDELGVQIQSALHSWRALLYADAAAIQQVDITINGLDVSFTKLFLGIGDD